MTIELKRTQRAEVAPRQADFSILISTHDSYQSAHRAWVEECQTRARRAGPGAWDCNLGLFRDDGVWLDPFEVEAKAHAEGRRDA
jgi:hypothetical protein